MSDHLLSYKFESSEKSKILGVLFFFSVRLGDKDRIFVVVLPDSTSSSTSSYWCYQCSCFVRVWREGAVVCPDCDGGFLEEVGAPPSSSPPVSLRRRISFATAYVDLSTGGSAMASRPLRTSEVRFRRNRRGSAGQRSPFNPVILLRSPSNGRHVANAAAITNSFELYYDDGTGSGLRPLSESISDFLMGSGFDRLLEQLAQIEINGIGDERGCEHPPASKAAIESMPSIEIVDDHIEKDCHCTICMEPFELGSETREMPCQHIYHQDCILRWLSLRNSCPVCRLEMPRDASAREATESVGDATARNDMETVGLRIWRLPGGGFAVGRFAGGTRPGEREFPVVYTEMDGGFNNDGAPRRISWTSRSNRSRESWGILRAIGITEAQLSGVVKLDGVLLISSWKKKRSLDN
ncbi:hypothetical protein ZIOFF_053661 [Zingiber officinale]|uniref:RING-type E3 ubiquitin transferase n=1 Tax=Zingiber officinale TaxID=94328 RepID=A0A8J5KD29_ZINOF|nr:hypothetical protein ZIOFF_053661 [Zingiber officinale]